MNREGILKVQLFNLEQNAETLERIVYNDLTALHSLPNHKAEEYEPKILRKLEKLDEMQDEIDTVTAELKAAGWYESRTTGRNIYEYKPKATTGEPVKKRRGRPRKTEPAVTTKPKPQAKPAAPKITPWHWDEACRFMELEEGLLTVKDVEALFGISDQIAGAWVREWAKDDKLVVSSRAGGPYVRYCHWDDTENHETTKLLHVLEDGPKYYAEISRALGYDGKSQRVRKMLTEYLDDGTIEEVPGQKYSRLQLRIH